MANNPNIERLDAVQDMADPREVLWFALEEFPEAAISFSGAEDVVLIDMALRIRPDVRVFSLDTGRLHPETYRFLESGTTSGRTMCPTTNSTARASSASAASPAPARPCRTSTNGRAAGGGKKTA